jgi:Uma2 family endonuclease
VSAALRHPMIGPYSVADWLALDPSVDGSRLELIFGYLHVTLAPSGEHQYAAYRLTRLVDDALRAAGRTDLHVVPAVNVEISTAWRTALIPDVVVLTRKPVGVSFAAEDLALAVEIWSPGNPRAERETKMAAYAGAGVPFLWTIDQGHDLRGLTLNAYRLEHGEYELENTVEAAATVTAAPIPIPMDVADLRD